MYFFSIVTIYDFLPWNFPLIFSVHLYYHYQISYKLLFMMLYFATIIPLS